MYVLACCDNDGKCIGFLRNDRTVESKPDQNFDSLMKFKSKKETGELCMQINLGHSLLPDGCPFRVTPYKVR